MNHKEEICLFILIFLTLICNRNYFNTIKCLFKNVTTAATNELHYKVLYNENT